MLVLSRKKNESIVVNDDITIVVVRSTGTRFLGVEAPQKRYLSTVGRSLMPSAATKRRLVK